MSSPAEVLPPPPPPPPPGPPGLELPPFKFSLLRDKFGVDSVVITTTWEEFVEFMLQYVEQSPCTLAPGPLQCAGKSCPHKAHSSIPDNFMAWSPVEIEGQRLDKNVRAVTLLSLDFDHLSVVEFERLSAKLRGWECVWHTTHSHRADDVCVRVVFAVSRRVLAAEFHRFLAASIQFLDLTVVNKKAQQQPDPTCKNRSRLYFRPSYPTGAPHDAGRERGRVLDVDEVLAFGATIEVPQPPSYDAVEREIIETGDWDLDSQHVVDAIQVMVNYFPPSRRHPLAMAIAGMLRAHGATRDDAFYIVREICRQGGSQDPDARATTVDHTFALTDDSSMTGFTRVGAILDEFLGEGEGVAVAREFGDYLTRASNEAFLRLVRRAPDRAAAVAHAAAVAAGTVDPSTPPPPAPPPPPLPAWIEDPAAIRSVVRGLAQQRAGSFDRNGRVAGVLLRRALDGEQLAFTDAAADVETVRDGANVGVTPDFAARSVVGALAFRLPVGTPWDPVRELFRLSLSKLREATGEDWLGKAEGWFVQAQQEREVEQFKQRQAAEVARAASVALMRRRAGLPPEAPPPPPDGKDWKDLLVKNAAGKPASTFNNVQLILEHDPELKGMIRWNEHEKKLEIWGGFLSPYAQHGETAIGTAVQNYLILAHDVSLGFNDVARRVVLAARSNSYDPLQDWLRSLQWDGGSRTEMMLTRYFGVKDSEHTRRISRRWLVGAVARAFEPGSKFDNVLVFVGLQGLRKTSAFEALGGLFYSSSEINIRDKDAKILAGVAWLCELAELEGMRTSENRAQKSFLTNRHDFYRPPYEKGMQRTPRRVVFVGSTNEMQFLSDDTGSRRWWPFKCGMIDIAALLADAEQLWAEAVATYFEHLTCPECAASVDTVFGQKPRCAEHRWWLNREEEAAAAGEAQPFEEEQPWMAWRDRITIWWRTMPVGKRPTSLTVSQAAMEAGDLAPDRVNRSVQTLVGIAMTKLGFIHVPSEHHYVPSENLRDMPVRPGLFAIAGGKKDEKKPDVPDGEKN